MMARRRADDHGASPRRRARAGDETPAPTPWSGAVRASYVARTLTFCLVWTGAMLLAPRPARAGPFDTFGAGATGGAHAGAGMAHPRGAEAVHANIGALTEVGDDQLLVGIQAAYHEIEILLDERPAGYAVPALDGDSPAIPSSQTGARDDTTEVAPMYALLLGGVTSLGLEDLRLGALFLLPTNPLLTMDTHFADERERLASNRLHFELLGDRVRRFDIQFGMAYRLASWLSLGVGATFLPGARASNQVAVEDPSDQSDIDLNLSAETRNAWGALVGAHFETGAGWSFGASFRSAVAMRVGGSNRIRLRGTAEPVVQEFSLVPSYSPARADLGAAWELGRTTLMLDARYTLWSRYLDRHGRRPGFRDTVSGRLGVEHRTDSQMRLRAGLGYVPTPVPAQTGRTNYVDNDRLLASLGAAHPFEIAGRRFTAGWFVQLHLLSARHTVKSRLDTHPDCAPDVTVVCDEVPDDTADRRTGRRYPEARGLQTGNPGFPGFSSGGWIAALGATLSWEARP
jgi:hypothetical protein